MATPNLNLTHVTESQANKETTINVALDGLDDALNDLEAIVITGDRDLTAAEFRGAFLIKMTGTPGAGFTLRIPASISRLFGILNLTDADCVVEVTDQGTDAVTVTQGTASILHSDGADIIPYASSSPGAFTDTNTTDVVVKDTGVTIASSTTTLNFVGDVQVYLNSDGSVDIDIQGGQGGGGGGYPANNVVEKTEDFTLTAADFNGNRVIKVNAVDYEVFAYLPDDLSPTEPCEIVQEGSAPVTVIADGSGVTIKSKSGFTTTNGQYTAMVVQPDHNDPSGNAYWLFGDLV